MCTGSSILSLSSISISNPSDIWFVVSNPNITPKTNKINLFDILDYANTGVQGQIGPQGDIGEIGPQGHIGDTGFQGPQGFQGDIGLGITGPQGFQGSIGPQGLQGNIGITGSQGFNGISGAQGIQGSIGITGLQGSVGISGPQGFQGSIGINGLQGAQGNQGFQGNIGNTGLQGSQGLQGSVGLGITGPQGFQGNIGVGTTGPQGLQGINATGSQGPQGFQGLKGITGSDVFALYYFAPTNGGTVTLNRGVNIIEPAGGILSLTLNFPSTASNTDTVNLSIAQSITTINIIGGTVIGTIGSAALGSFAKYIYYSSTNKWYRIG